MPDGDLIAGRDSGIAGVRRVVGFDDPGIGERWNVFGNGIIQSELSFFHQHHHCRADDGFCHGGYAEEVVRPHRDPGIDIAVTEGFVIDDFAIPDDHHHRAAELSVVDMLFDEGIDPAEPFGGHPVSGRRFGYEYALVCLGLEAGCKKADDENERKESVHTVGFLTEKI